MDAGRPRTMLRHALGIEPRNLGDPGDGGNIQANQAGYVALISSGGAETRTLDDPQWEGQIMDLFFETDGGDIVITADSPVNQTGNNTLTTQDAGDHLRLVGARDGAGGYEWRVVANDGFGLTTV